MVPSIMAWTLCSLAKEFSMKVSPQFWKRGALALSFALSVLAPPIAQAQGQAPDTVAGAKSYGVPIPGQYIVVFKPNVRDPETLARSMALSARGELRHIYTHAIKGFSASLPEAALNGIRNHPNVAYIEQDVTVGINQTTTQTSPPSWGLDRIDQVGPVTDASGNWDLTQSAYTYNTAASNVTAYIIDTGIYAGHADFGDRVQGGAGFVSSGSGRRATTDPSTDDCNGHGTHVAGTVGGGQYGVAKEVKLVPVRVLDCNGSGSTSGVIAGIDWVAQDAVNKHAVANMSLGGGASSSLDSAVAGAVQAGVVMVVAAGNDNADACNYSPARAPSAITVGATGHRVSVNGVTRIDQYDGRADYSNYGNCLDLFAPGSLITSAWIGGQDATNTISGTSMATPHVTGVAALILSANPTASPAAIENFLATTGTTVVTSSQSPGHDKLIYSLAAGTPAAPTGGTGTGSGATNVAISGLTGASITNFVNGWKAIAQITVGVVNSDGSLGSGYKGATVSVSFTSGGSASCTTDAVGRCDAISGGIKKNVSRVTATVTGVTGADASYLPERNKVTSIPINP